MKTLCLTTLRTLLRTAPDYVDGSGDATKSQLRTALALLRHANAHRDAAKAWHDAQQATGTAHVDALANALALAHKAGAEPEDYEAFSQPTSENLRTAHNVHWEEYTRLQDMATAELN